MRKKLLSVFMFYLSGIFVFDIIAMQRPSAINTSCSLDFSSNVEEVVPEKQAPMTVGRKRPANFGAYGTRQSTEKTTPQSDFPKTRTQLKSDCFVYDETEEEENEEDELFSFADSYNAKMSRSKISRKFERRSLDIKKNFITGKYLYERAAAGDIFSEMMLDKMVEKQECKKEGRSQKKRYTN